MNEFSIVCRVLGTLFYRQPQDPLLVPLFALIKEGKLQQHWPLEQDDLLKRLQQGCDVNQLATDFNAMFVGSECSVSPFRSDYVEGASEAEVRTFLQQRGMPLAEAPADHFGQLLLAASWLEASSSSSASSNNKINAPKRLRSFSGRWVNSISSGNGRRSPVTTSHSISRLLTLPRSRSNARINSR